MTTFRFSFNKSERLCRTCEKIWFVPSSPNHHDCIACRKKKEEKRSSEANRAMRKMRKYKAKVCEFCDHRIGTDCYHHDSGAEYTKIRYKMSCSKWTKRLGKKSMRRKYA